MRDTSGRQAGSRIAWKRVAAALAIAASAIAVARLVGATEFGRRIENTSYDLRVAYAAEPAPASTAIVLVDISESTVRALEPMLGRWPWPRAVHAAAIDYLVKAGARVIAYDVLFSEREGRSEAAIGGRVVTGAESDRTLVESVRAAGNVVLLGDATFEGASGAASAPIEPPVLPGPAYAPGPGFEPRPSVLMPFDDLRLAARSLGHNRLRRDAGSDFARSMQPFVDVSGVAVPSLGLAGALAYLDARPEDVRLNGRELTVGPARLHLIDEAGRGPGPRSLAAVLRFSRPTMDSGGVRSFFPSYAFFDVLVSADNEMVGKPPIIPASAFADKLVFVGTSAAGLFDRYPTPFGGGAGGVELHATLAANVLSGRGMRRVDPWLDVLAVTAAAAASAALAVALPVVASSSAVVLLLAAGMAALTVGVGRGLWIAAVEPSIAMLMALFLGVAWQYFVEGRQKREMKRLFGRYVSKDVIDELLANPSLARLGGQRRHMTVLFSDIRGFTAASEKSTPEAVVAQLNEYFGAMVEVLFRHRGTLDKFVGDMVMGLFGAPLEDPDHADHAVGAAVEMVEVLGRLNARWSAEGRPTLEIGVGINTGDMIAGNVGAEAIMSYTVIGDAVNLGSRLESLNKEYGTRILMSEATRASLKTPFVSRPMGAVTVKGKTEPIEVHEVVVSVQ